MKDTINKKPIGKKIGWLLAAIHTLVTLVCIYALWRLRVMFPPQLFYGTLIVLILFLALCIFLAYKKNGYTQKVLSIVLSICIVAMTNYAFQTANLTGGITNANKDTHVISVLVLKMSQYETMDDLKDKIFAGNTAQDSKNIEKAKELILEKDKITVNVTDYSNNETLINDLYSGKVDALLVSGGHLALIGEIDKDFEEKVRVITSYQYEETVDIGGERPTVESDTYSIFLSGIDTYGPVSTVSRSDVNMIITVNPKTHQILLTSIPRDYYVTLASFGARDKLTHAGIYGVNESVKTLENLLDINIDFYLRVNFSSVTKIVDALGGVDVYTKYTFTTRSGQYDFQAGYNAVDGTKALAFVRERYNLPNGDNDRVYHQQELIKGIIEKAKSPSIITNFGPFLSAIGNSVQMSLSETELQSIIREQIDGMPSWDIVQYQLTGSGSKSTTTYSMPGWDLYVMEPNGASVKTASDLIHEMEKGNTIQKP